MFVSASGALQPTIPAALVDARRGEGAVVLPIDFASWRNGGFDLLPRGVLQPVPERYRPDLTVAHAQRAGWPLNVVHPVIGVYHHYPAANYVPLLEPRRRAVSPCSSPIR